MEIIEIKTFIEKWEKIFNYNIDNLKKLYQEGKPSYTSAIFYNDISITKQIGLELGYSEYSLCRAGYYGIDAVLYEDKFKMGEVGDGTWLSKINIAIEHELDFNYYLFAEVSEEYINMVLNYLSNLMNELKINIFVYVLIGEWSLDYENINWKKYELSNSKYCELKESL